MTMKVNDASSASQSVVPLTPEQAGDIDELMRAYHASLDISMDRDLPRDRASFSDLVNIAELSVRRVIAMAKQVGGCCRLGCGSIFGDPIQSRSLTHGSNPILPNSERQTFAWTCSDAN